MKIILALLIIFFSSFSRASDYTTVIIPYPPGGSADLAVKHFQHWLQKKNVNIVINYKPGAEGLVGTIDIMKSNSTGKIIGFTSITPIQQALNSNKNLEVEFITAMHGAAIAIVSNPKLGITDLESLEKFVKLDKQISIGYGAIAQRIYLEQLVKNINPTKSPIYIPYKGTAQVLNDIMGGHIDLGMVPAIAAKAHADNGKLNLVSADIKIKNYKFETIQSRYKNWKNFSISGFIAPKNTDPAIIAYWRKLVKEYLDDEEVKQELENNYYYFYVPFGEKYFRELVNSNR